MNLPLLSTLKSFARRQLERSGYRLARVAPDASQSVNNQLNLQQLRAASYDNTVPLPEGAEDYLRQDHPHLIELRKFYAALDLPMRLHSLWNPQRLERHLEMAHFRGDNAYRAQLRAVTQEARLKMLLFTSYIGSIDSRKLLTRLQEDGAFGCWTFKFHNYPPVSRDLLDSISEMYFLDQYLEGGLFERQAFNVLDIGAGYGRLAYRMSQAVPGLNRYYCTDAVAESTFLCEYYLRYRQCEAKTQVVPLHQLVALQGTNIDLAINTHSFSEMCYEAIQGWLQLLATLKVSHLMVVPNDPEEFLSRETDGTRRNFFALFAEAGYRKIARAPASKDANLRELGGIFENRFLFERC
jgi:hypothetical protein